ncbi:11792_t:CDS:2, partial [Gigaspora margarita]
TIVVNKDVPAREWEGRDSENKFGDCFYQEEDCVVEFVDSVVRW